MCNCLVVDLQRALEGYLAYYWTGTLLITTEASSNRTRSFMFCSEHSVFIDDGITYKIYIMIGKTSSSFRYLFSYISMLK